MFKFFSSVASLALLMGCNPFAQSLKENVANQAIHNRTLSKAAMIMDGVKAWSASHGGLLPNASQFRQEVRPVLPPTNGFGITEDELQSAFQAFDWTFAGGSPPPPKGLESPPVGRLDDPYGGAIAHANGEVSLGYIPR